MFRFSAILFVILSFVACESDYSFRGDENSISFSADTLSFDTVFSGNASVTAKLMLYNRSANDMTIDDISLVGGSSSLYNVSINGTAGTHLNGVRLRSGDSLHIFVNIFPPINNIEPYYIAEDDIVATAGTHSWTAHLWACALTAQRISGTISTNTQWQQGVPYLISDTLNIAPNTQLSISEGTEIYMAPAALISIEGSLCISGTRNAPVALRTSRLSSFYSDIPGQWQGIELHGSNATANMTYTQITNATTALQADSATSLRLTDVEIHDAQAYAIDANQANVEVSNCVIYNCGSSLLQIDGGTAKITHCTLVNYYKWNARNVATITVSNNNLLSFEMLNSVVVGNLSNEIDLADDISAEQCLISHCYIRTNNRATDTDERFNVVIIGKEPLFVDKDNNDYHLQDNSPLIDAADAQYSTNLPTDHDGNSRIADDGPDIGAFEIVNTSK